jgi:hypothetical protein
MRWILLVALLGIGFVWWSRAEAYVRWLLRHLTLHSVLGLVLIALTGVFLSWRLAVVLAVFYVPLAVGIFVVTRRGPVSDE